MKDFSKTFFLYMVCLTVLVSGCKKKTTDTDDTPLSVDYLTVKEDSVMIRKTYPGVLEASNKADVVARVNGTILSQLFTPGDYVHKGQALYTIETTVYSDAVKESEAQLSTARSAYSYAEKRYEAMKKALEYDAVAEMEVIQARSNMEQAQAEIRQAQAALKDAQTKLGYCTVRAPISGYITDSSLKQGSYVGGEASPVSLATVYDNSSMQVTFSISDGAYISMFTSGKNIVKPSFNSMPITFSQPLTHDYSAAISYLAPSVNTGSGTLELKARLANPYNELKDGMYATIALPYRSEPHAMLVNDASVQTDQRGSYLYIINDKDEVVYTPVQAGALYHDTLRVIESGVHPGDRYVSKALLKVRSGMKVKPVAQK